MSSSYLLYRQAHGVVDLHKPRPLVCRNWTIELKLFYLWSEDGRPGGVAATASPVKVRRFHAEAHAIYVNGEALSYAGLCKVFGSGVDDVGEAVNE